jgi:2-polyprenyl-3-methyl-5-hydroxy-6-metoxy-1,4-benzoquinol methylase
MKCKICGSSAPLLFQASVLGRHRVAYHRCEKCQFLQTEEPYWLAEAYGEAITEIDLGPVNRAMVTAPLIESLILSSFSTNGRYIDYGGGYGLLVRLMRDRGFDFYWHDAYCENIFAKQFIAEAGTHYDMLTAFEVMEHLADPMTEVERMLQYSDNMLVSTLIAPQDLQSVADWWYFSPDHGQHISFYSEDALRHIAAAFNLHFCTDGVGMHLLSRTRVSPAFFRFLTQQTLAVKMLRRLQRRRLKKRSLLTDDFRKVSGYDLTA